MISGSNRDDQSDLLVKPLPSAGKGKIASAVQVGIGSQDETSRSLPQSRNSSSNSSPIVLQRAVVAKSRSDCCGVNNITNPGTSCHQTITSSISSSVLIESKKHYTTSSRNVQTLPSTYDSGKCNPTAKIGAQTNKQAENSLLNINPLRCRKDTKQKVAGMPPRLASYYQNAPLKKLRHPLEENIFTSLLITLVAIGVAIVIGIPILILSGALLIGILVLRYAILVAHGFSAYIRYMCSNRNIPQRSLPHIFPRDRLAFANDIRWLGRKSPKKCQSILHTILVFEGSMDLTNLRQLIQSRVLSAETSDGQLAYPRLLQRLKSLVSGYRWTDDGAFDIKNHIYLGPACLKTEAEIQKYIGILLTQKMNQEKPLWEIVVLPNYGAKKDTLAVLRVHQCLADGMTLVRILSHNLADHTQMHIPQRPHFAGLSFGFNVLRSFIVGPLTLFLWLFLTFRDKNVFTRPLTEKNAKRKNNKIKRNKKRSKTCDLSPGCGNSSPSHNPSSSCDTPTVTNSSPSSSSLRDIRSARQSKKYKVTSCASSSPFGDSRQKGHHHHSPYSEQTHGANRFRGKSSKLLSSKCIWKVVWSAHMTVPKVARVKQIMRSSFNDVLLSAAAGSIRCYMQEVGIPCPGDCKVLIPVDLRNDITSPKSSTKLGCKVASVLAKVPSGTEAAIPRLWATRHRLDELKASADPVVAYGATTLLMNVLPHKLAISVLNSIINKASFQFSNLPGPGSTLVIGGFPLKGIYPIYPPAGKIRVAISVFTYADQVHVTVVGHRSYRNIGPSILMGITRQVEQLSRQLSQRRVPGESRRSARNQPPPEMAKPATREIHIQLQMVQEELQHISHKLDAPEDYLTDSSSFINKAGLTGQIAGCSSTDSSLLDVVSTSSLGYDLYGNLLSSNAAYPSGHVELRTRLRSLKNEFNELIGELRRRSSIVEGAAISFEDEEMEAEFRKPRKRALSVASATRRNSVFSSRSITTPESSQIYSSDEDLSNSPPHGNRMYSPAADLRHSNSPIRTTAV